MNFEWQTSPDVFVQGMEQYTARTFDALYAICVKHAQVIETYMRQNATWQDECMPGREYLRAAAFLDESGFQVGIRVWYDLELYRQQCGEPPFDWGTRHEMITFAKSGVIGVIVPRGETEGNVSKTALGSLADDLWDEVRALYQ